MTFSVLCGLVVLWSVVDRSSGDCPTREWIEKSLNNSRVPGAAIVVVNGTQTLYEQTFGYHSFCPARFVDAEKSIFSLASISKTLVAVAVMKLVEEERLDLDANVNQYLSELDYRVFHPNYTSHSITLRRLLSHSASIAVPEAVQLGLYRLDDVAFEQMTLAQTLFTHVNGNTSNWLPRPPGSVSFYSNDGLSLAGLVVERVAKMPFDQYVKANILQPLQIDTSRVGIRLADFADREELVKHYAYAYNSSQLAIWRQGMPQLNVTPCLSQDGFPTWLCIPLFSFSSYPAGLFRMSARSLSIFLRMFVNNGSSLLSARSIAEMKLIVGGGLIPYYDADAMNAAGVPVPSFGLSWYWQTLSDGRRYLGHSGALPGARHSMLINEEHTIGMIILTNADSNVPAERSREVQKLLENIHQSLFRCYEIDMAKSSAFHPRSALTGLLIILLRLTGL